MESNHSTEQIDSYSKFFRGSSESAYNESLELISMQSEQIDFLTAKVKELAARRNLSNREKERTSVELESKRTETEALLKNLNSLPVRGEKDFEAIQPQLPAEEQREQQSRLQDQKKWIQKHIQIIEQLK